MDTGAYVSVISDRTYQQTWATDRRPKLEPTEASLRTYTGQQVKVLGAIFVSCSYRDQHKRLRLLVVTGNGPTLLGRDWLGELRLDWKELHRVHVLLGEDL